MNVEQPERLTKELIKEIYEYKENQGIFKEISLATLADGLFLKLTEDFSGTLEDLQEVLLKPIVEPEYPKDLVALEKLHDKYIYALANGKKIGIPDAIKPEGGKMPKLEGINVSTYYIGAPGSMTELHHEDKMQLSVNRIILWGEKWWLFIINAHTDNRTAIVIICK